MRSSLNNDNKQKDWFSEWFNSPYYHILYKNRDYKEASFFIDNLSQTLGISPQHKVMDLACGKGRHSIYLNKKGLDVTGLDLSAKNIASAKVFQNSKLQFHIHDMREVFRENCFDFVLNLFTSFGYFENEADNLKCIHSIADTLRKDGKLVLDFLNPSVVIDRMIPQEIKSIQGIDFLISKSYKNGYIVKDIRFTDGGRKYHYRESVKAVTEREFLTYFAAAGLKIINCYGNYELAPFNLSKSGRMIFIALKEN